MGILREYAAIRGKFLLLSDIRESIYDIRESIYAVCGKMRGKMPPAVCGFEYTRGNSR
jgi:hypothetical protein